jgi:hypothetical protein
MLTASIPETYCAHALNDMLFHLYSYAYLGRLIRLNGSLKDISRKIFPIDRNETLIDEQNPREFYLKK